ncbi:uncharacterized protein N7503_007596 [Penicillium pulvis]|uniref:uncharacterized protein n=1 Tax=Penicillium pulvis TaxID=1562058 RepID=UPI002547CD9C|nr:uncharacterized protein N7503_007596 [Penicillium pulvis]KAJ5798300.1 hypothetical protein N7503_007596 [Penicillium pulvis]
MNFLRQPCSRIATLRSFRTPVGITSPQANFSRRSYATTGPGDQKGGTPRCLHCYGFAPNDLPLEGDKKKPNTSSIGEHHGANQEYAQNAEGNQGNDSNSTTSTHDEPRAMGSSKGPTSMSFKQEGLSNADTMNPYVNEPGKSKKGEGETETAKVKGTVKPDRPQV